MATPTRSEELEQMLADERSELTFAAIRGLIDTWPEAEGRAVAIARALAALEEWPDTVRAVGLGDDSGGDFAEAEFASPSWALVRTLNVEEPRESWWPSVAGRRELNSVRRFALEWGVGDDPLDVLTNAPHLRSLKALTVQGFGGATPSALERLARAPWVRSLESLNLSIYNDEVVQMAFPSIFAAGKAFSCRRLQVFPAPEELLPVLEVNAPSALRELSWRSSSKTFSIDWDRFPQLLSGLVELDLSLHPLGDDGLARLAGCRYLGRLERLALGDQKISPEGISALANSPFIPNLTHLGLCGNPLGDAGWKAVAELPLRRLSHLDLAGTKGSDAGAEHLARAPWLSGLVELDLRTNELHAEGARTLAASPHWRDIRVLDVSSNHIDEAFVVAFAGSASLTGLRSLTFRQDLPPIPKPIGPAAMWALATSKSLVNLTALTLDFPQFDSTAITALREGSLLSRLQALRLSLTDLKDADIESLAGSLGRGQLRSLELSSCSMFTSRSTFSGITSRGVRALAGSRGVAGLWQLALPRARLGDEGMIALAESPYLNHLVYLDLQDSELGAEGSAVLARSANMTRLGEIRLSERFEPWIDATSLRPIVRAHAKALCAIYRAMSE